MLDRSRADCVFDVTRLDDVVLVCSDVDSKSEAVLNEAVSVVAMLKVLDMPASPVSSAVEVDSASRDDVVVLSSTKEVVSDANAGTVTVVSTTPATVVGSGMACAVSVTTKTTVVDPNIVVVAVVMLAVLPLSTVC
jgi:hypothetical protein